VEDDDDESGLEFAEFGLGGDIIFDDDDDDVMDVGVG